MRKETKLNITDADKLHALTRIMQGLLASGCYVDKADDEADDESSVPGIRSYDFGKDWKEDGAPCRWMPLVVMDAEDLLDKAIMTISTEDSEP